MSVAGPHIAFSRGTAAHKPGYPIPALACECSTPIEDEPGHCVWCGRDLRDVIELSWWLQEHGRQRSHTYDG